MNNLSSAAKWFVSVKVIKSPEQRGTLQYGPEMTFCLEKPTVTSNIGGEVNHGKKRLIRHPCCLS